MSRTLQLKRGNAAQNAAYTGAPGEPVCNTTNGSIHVHDGTTPGGTALVNENLSNLSEAGRRVPPQLCFPSYEGAQRIPNPSNLTPGNQSIFTAPTDGIIQIIEFWITQSGAPDVDVMINNRLVLRYQGQRQRWAGGTLLMRQGQVLSLNNRGSTNITLNNFWAYFYPAG